MKKIAISMIMATIGCGASAQTLAYDEDWPEAPRHWMISISAGLNTDGYETDLGVAWYPIETIGIKLSLGWSGEIPEFGDWIWDDCYYDDKDYAGRFKVMPSVDLRTPYLFHLGSVNFRLFANPGISLSPGSQGSKGADWFNWQGRAGVELNIDDFVVRLGYGCSNFNLYSGYPISHNGYDKADGYLTHTGFITIGFSF